MEARTTPETLVANIQHDCPALLPLLDSAVAWVEGGHEIAARASDGVVVALGSVVLRRDRLNLASYLEAHPTPDTW